MINGNTYTITVDQDLNPLTTEALITLRNAVDNSIIAFGYTPLTFNSNTTEIEVHFFDEASCAKDFDLIILALQNETTLGIEENSSMELTVFYKNKEQELVIESNKVIEFIDIYDMLGKKP